MKYALWVLVLVVIGSVSGCSDAKKAEWTRLGDSADVTAYTFGQEIYSGESSGKLLAKEGGYLFVEKSTGDTLQIKGVDTTFVIRYKK